MKILEIKIKAEKKANENWPPNTEPWFAAYYGYIYGFQECESLNTSTNEKQLAAPAVVGRSEQLPCKHVEKLMQGDGFVYAICALCGEDL
jgi:hypothetical protein